jgi:hypothetical protein
MTHFHSDLYVWICKHWKDEPERARELQEFLGLASVIEFQLYPSTRCTPFSSRAADQAVLPPRRCPTVHESMRLEVEQMMRHLTPVLGEI